MKALTSRNAVRAFMVPGLVVVHRRPWQPFWEPGSPSNASAIADAALRLPASNQGPVHALGDRDARRRSAEALNNGLRSTRRQTERARSSPTLRVGADLRGDLPVATTEAESSGRGRAAYCRGEGRHASDGEVRARALLCIPVVLPDSDTPHRDVMVVTDGRPAERAIRTRRLVDDLRPHRHTAGLRRRFHSFLRFRSGSARVPTPANRGQARYTSRAQSG